MPRKVLVIEDEPAIRNTLYVLLAALKCEGDVAYSGQQALAMISRESFDAVLLDVRCADPPAEQVLSKIIEIRPNLMGRVLVITGEFSDPVVLEMLTRNSVPSIPQARLVQDLWGRLRTLFGQLQSSKVVQ
ncbi:MAG: response regulator [Terriglobia bacterium]